MTRVIGIDLDNTIICYDQALYGIALQEGLINKTTLQDKTVIRDAIRQLQDGESRWQQLQARLYGADIHKAELMDGAFHFLRESHACGNKMVVISHKTRYAAADPLGSDLRQAALAWLENKGILDPSETGLSADDIFFADTREGKLALIKQQQCEVFIDDLVEVLLEPEFPTNVDRILLAACAEPLEGIVQCLNWQQVSDYVCAAS